MVDQINDTVAVAVLVVVPGHQLHEGAGELDPSLGIKDRRSVISKEVSRDHHILSVTEDSCNKKNLNPGRRKVTQLYLSWLLPGRPPSSCCRSPGRWPPSGASR